MDVHPTDEQLLACARDGDEAALERLLLRHHARLHATVARRVPAELRSLIDADDILQEAYVAVFGEIQRFQPRHEAALFAWIDRIAERKLFDAIRAQKAQKRGGDRQRLEEQDGATGSVLIWLEHLAVYERTPSQSAVRVEAIRAMQQAMADLSPDYRTALALRYIDGLTVAEAAAEMDRSESAYCVLCHRALNQLRVRMARSTILFPRGL